MERHSTERGKEDGFWENYYNSKPAPGGVKVNRDGNIEYGEVLEASDADCEGVFPQS